MFRNENVQWRVPIGPACALLALLALTGCGRPVQPHTLVTVSHPAGSSPTARIVSKAFEVHGVVRVVAKFKSGTGNYGFGGIIVPVARRDEPARMLLQEHPFVVSPSSPEDVVAGVHGQVVVVVMHPGYMSWTLALQAGQ